MNEGAVALAGVMGRKGWIQEDVEKALDLRPKTGLVSLWLHGHRKPGRKKAHEIEKKLGIPMSLWDVPSKAQEPKKTWGSAS